jgi:hypothetical protein
LHNATLSALPAYTNPDEQVAYYFHLATP